MSEQIEIPKEIMAEIRRIIKDNAFCFDSEEEFIKEALRASILRYL